MTMIRLKRIDLLFKEADEVADTRSDMQESHRDHFSHKLDGATKEYEGEEML